MTEHGDNPTSNITRSNKAPDFQFPTLRPDGEVLESFKSWTRRDYRIFVDALKRNGRNATVNLIQEVALQTVHIHGYLLAYYPKLINI